MIEHIINSFIDGKIISIEENDHGRINDSFVVTYLEQEQKKQLLIQKINTSIFTDVSLLSKNICDVTSFLEQKKIPTLKPVKTKQNTFLLQQDKDYYRAFEYIFDSVSYDHPKEKEIVFEIGKAYGELLFSLKDFPLSSFESVLKDFHNTKKRWEHFLTTYQEDPYQRRKLMEGDFLFLLQKKHYIDEFFDLYEKGDFPFHLIHGDTKANNVLFKKEEPSYYMVVDFDTLSLDTLLFDYGDGIRSIAATKDNTLDQENFTLFTTGFIKGCFPLLTEIEKNSFILSVLVITLELAIRYLDDYLQKDIYFKVESPLDNLVRARNQLSFFKDVERHKEVLQAQVNEIYNNEKKA